MTESQGVDQYGVLKPVPPRVLAVVSLWVLIADGIFWGMSAKTLGLAEWLCFAQGLFLSSALFVLGIWFVPRLIAALLATAIYGLVIFSFCGLIGFSVLVALQVGLMHYCALAVLAPWARKLRRGVLTLRNLQ